MKKIIIASIAFLMALHVWAQSPDTMSYQAVVRNTDDNLIVTTTLGMQISILQGTSNGIPIYVETHTPTTNVNGLVSLEIGTGTTSDVFSDIDWSNGPYYIKTETDVTGGTNYTITGVSQLMSVPYALYAKTTTELDPKVTEHFDFAEAATAGDVLQYNGSKWVKVTLSGDVTVVSNGVVTIADNTIATSKLQSASVTNPKLDKSNIPLSGFGAAEDNVAMGNNKITDLADPTEAQDAVTKNYTYSKQEVDALVAQLSEAVADLEAQIDRDEVQDIDGNWYDFIAYGNQVWTVEDAFMETYRDGTPIPQVTDDTEWSNLTTGAWCYFQNDPTKHKLYNWYAVKGIHDNDPSTPNKELAPEGWHVPTTDEGMVLVDYLVASGFNWDGTTTGNKVAKAMASRSGWNDDSGADESWPEYSPGTTNNSSGFNMLPFSRNQNGYFSISNGAAFIWNITEFDSSSANTYLIFGSLPSLIFTDENDKRKGFRVRFVKD